MVAGRREGQSGAPTKLTSEVQEQICTAIAAGIRPEVAARYCRVSPRSYYRWMGLGRARDADALHAGFVEAVEQALAEWEARDVLIVGEAAKNDWHAAAWRLERRLPKVYGRRERHEIANADEGSFKITAGSAFDPEKLSINELEQLIALTEKAVAGDG